MLARTRCSRLPRGAGGFRQRARGALPGEGRGSEQRKQTNEVRERVCLCAPGCAVRVSSCAADARTSDRHYTEGARAGCTVGNAAHGVGSARGAFASACARVYRERSRLRRVPCAQASCVRCPSWEECATHPAKRRSVHPRSIIPPDSTLQCPCARSPFASVLGPRRLPAGCLARLLARAGSHDAVQGGGPYILRQISARGHSPKQCPFRDRYDAESGRAFI